MEQYQEHRSNRGDLEDREDSRPRISDSSAVPDSGLSPNEFFVFAVSLETDNSTATVNLFGAISF